MFDRADDLWEHMMSSRLLTYGSVKAKDATDVLRHTMTYMLLMMRQLPLYNNTQTYIRSATM